jgi:hypothetical protein
MRIVLSWLLRHLGCSEICVSRRRRQFGQRFPAKKGQSFGIGKTQQLVEIAIAFPFLEIAISIPPGAIGT